MGQLLTGGASELASVKAGERGSWGGSGSGSGSAREAVWIYTEVLEVRS